MIIMLQANSHPMPSVSLSFYVLVILVFTLLEVCFIRRYRKMLEAFS